MNDKLMQDLNTIKAACRVLQENKKGYLERIAFLEAELSKANHIPDGYVLVPIEPTDEQHSAARDWAVATIGHAIGKTGSLGCYKAMIAAAPKPEYGE